MVTLLVLRPRPETRVANLAPGAVLAAAGVGGLADSASWSGWPFMMPLWFAAGCLMVRAWRMEVVRTADFVVVRGHLWTRRIPVSAIDIVTDHPAIRWRSASGRSGRWTPLWMFWTNARMLGAYRAHARQQIRSLRRSLGLSTSEPRD